MLSVDTRRSITIEEDFTFSCFVLLVLSLSLSLCQARLVVFWFISNNSKKEEKEVKNFLEFLTEQWRESWLLWFFSLQNLLLELEARLAHQGYCSLVVLVVGGHWFRWGSGIKGCLQFGLLWILWKQTYLIWVLMVIPQRLLFFLLWIVLFTYFLCIFFFLSRLSFGLKIETFHPFLYCWYGDF